MYYNYRRFIQSITFPTFIHHKAFFVFLSEIQITELSNEIKVVFFCDFIKYNIVIIIYV